MPTVHEIAQRIHDGTQLDLRLAREAAQRLLTQRLEDALYNDVYGDTNADAELENVLLFVQEELVEALFDVGYSDDGEANGAAADEFLDGVMANADVIVADAQDRLAEEEPGDHRRRAGLPDEL